MRLYRFYFLSAAFLCLFTQARAGDPANRLPPPAANNRESFRAVEKSTVLIRFSKVIDDMKALVDEWGTLSFAPIIFAPPSYPVKGGSGTTSPFKLAEATDDAKKFTLEGLYEDADTSQGQVLSTVRTGTKTMVAGGINSDATAQVIDQAKLDIFKTNTQRAIAADTTKRQVSDTQLTAAKSRLENAKKAANAAAEGLAAATAQQSTAVADLKAANDRLTIETNRPIASQDTTAINNARLAVVQAERNKTVADNAVTAANGVKTRSDAEVTEATTALSTAETNFSSALNGAISLPTNAPTTAALGNPLTEAAGTSDNLFGTMGTMSPASSLDTLGDKALPALVKSKETKDGSFAPLARINSAAAALTVKNIHTFLGNPEAALQFVDKRILFGVSSLSVNPGWRTRRDFKAVINAEVKCTLGPAHSETIREILRDPKYPVGFRKVIANSYQGVLTQEQRAFFDRATAWGGERCKEYIKQFPPQSNSPGIVVSAVTPMVDSQNLDLASSIARQDEIALFLAATMAQAGSTASAKLFTSWAKLRRKDIATRTTVATANSSTFGGDAFSFEIGTRLRGVDDEDVKGTKAAQVLERQTFPVLLIFGMAADDARPQFSWDKDTAKIIIREPSFHASYSTQWSRTKHDFWTAFKPKRDPSDGYREVLKLGKEKERLNEQLKIANSPTSMQVCKATADTLENMEREHEYLNRALYGATFDLSLPAAWLVDSTGTDSTLRDPDIRVAGDGIHVEPTPLSFLDINVPTTILLRGSNLDLIDEAKIAVISRGVQKTAAGAKVLGRDTISIEVQAIRPEDGEVRFELPHKSGTESASTRVVRYVVDSQQLPTLLPWFSADYSVAGTFDNGSWTGRLELALRGTNLDRLASTGGIRGVGITAAPAGATISGVGPQGARVVTIQLTSREGSGEGLVEFTLSADPTRKVISHPFRFSFQNSLPPILKGWGNTNVNLAAGTVGQGGKLSGKLQLVLRGEGLSRLSSASVRGATATSTATIVTASNDTALVEVQLNDVSADVGQAFLEFSVQNTPPATRVFSEPFHFQLVRVP